MNLLTRDENELLNCFDCSSRVSAIADIRSSIPNLPDETARAACAALADKLSGLRDIDFSSIVSSQPEYYSAQGSEIKLSSLTLIPLEPREEELLYADPSGFHERGSVGHLSFDVGTDGCFLYEWELHQPDLNTPGFMRELNDIVNAMRTTNGPLHDLSSMTRISGMMPLLPNDMRSVGMKIETKDYTYMMRLSLGGHGSIQCYDRGQLYRSLQHSRSVLAKLHEHFDRPRINENRDKRMEVETR